MNWRRNFRKSILDRGFDYYLDDKVQNVQRTKNGFSATVMGGFEYDVEVFIENGKMIAGACTCPYARDGHFCKHMAALMYEIEGRNQGDFEEEKETKVNTRLDGSIEMLKKMAGEDDPSEYFNVRRILDNISFSEEEAYEALMLLNNEEIKNVKITEYMDYSGKRILQVEGRAKYYSWSDYLCVHFSDTEIENVHCDPCGIFGIRERKINLICKHIVALLVLADEKIRKESLSDYTDVDGKKMLEAFRKSNERAGMLPTAEVARNIKLIPIIESEEGRKCSLSFKIGKGKMFILKDIKYLVDSYKRRSKIQLGKKDEIDFKTDYFDEESEPCFELMKSIIEDEMTYYSRYNSYYYDYPMFTTRNIYLERRKADRVFELLNGRRVEFKKGPIKGLLFCEDDPEIGLDIRAMVSDGGVFRGISVTGDVRSIIKGTDYSYCIDGERFLRLTEDTAERIKPLASLWSESKGDTFSLSIGKNNISEFYHDILPGLEKIARINIRDEELIEEFVPPNAEFVFYLDAMDGDITCRVFAKYDDEEFLLESSQNNMDPMRMTRRENEVFEMVRELLPLYDGNQFSAGADEDVVYEFLRTGLDILLDLGTVNSTDAFNRLRIWKKTRISIGVSLESNLLDVSVTSDEISDEELLDILYSYRQKKKYHRLKNGDFVTLYDNSIADIAAMFDAMHISPKEFVKGKMKIPAYRALYLDKMLEENDGLYVDRDRHYRSLVKDFKTVKESDIEVPQSLKNTLRNYQSFGYKWLSVLDQYRLGGILADEMGLGKTLQVITLLFSGKEKGTALVVSPASLVYNWAEEFEKFAPSLKIGIVSGKPDERKEIIDDYQSYDVLITSYDILKRDIDNYDGMNFSYEIIDEAQYIKNHSTAAAKAVKVISAESRFALTGTPIENRLSELWSIFDYLMPGYLYSYEEFRTLIESPIVKAGNKDTVELLKKMVSPFILRRLKKDVIKDLPEKIEEVYYAKFDGKQEEVYNGQIVKIKNMLGRQDESDFAKNKIKILAELTKIRQICCDPNLIFDDYKGESAKKDAAMDIISSAAEGGHKILLFSQFTSMLEILQESLKARKIEYFKITGETPKHKRVELVKEFNSNDVPVFLISLKAGGTGLNLTGADIVIHYDPWWNIAVQNQATDRAHRIGQEKVVTVYKLIAKGTIEEKILKMQHNKKELADEILSGENGGIMRMSKEELMNIL